MGGGDVVGREAARGVLGVTKVVLHEPGEHELAVVADPVDVIRSGPVDLHDDVGMRSVDVWIADRRDRPGVVISAVPDAPGFSTILGPPVRLRVLLLTEGSGDGDLRDV